MGWQIDSYGEAEQGPVCPDGIPHPPSSFSLWRDSGYLYYPWQPKLCNKCSKLGHTDKDCTVQVCKNCKRKGHSPRACKGEAPCNLCGVVGNLFKDCLQIAKSYSQAAKPPWRTTKEEAAVAIPPVPVTRKTKETGRRRGPRQERAKPDQGPTQTPELQTTEEEMSAILESSRPSGLIDDAPQPAPEIQEELPWMKQERRKRRHSPPQATKKTRNKHLSNHNPYSDPKESEEEDEGPDDQLEQVSKVL
ncbi:hypothetical protein NDU88_005644 [Pleurodeles waltl]|uniref:CCHC-type domain-containing protein n=1 Tax=Pleurodeles waltl TaxID=8319 RepID=A0AAV7UMD4_PLEWA|nr:hypothetical protein NDU88_005644 [Pleurodeles waltl]